MTRVSLVTSTRSVAPWVGTGLVFVGSLTVVLIDWSSSNRVFSSVDAAGYLLMPPLFIALGFVIAASQPGNRVAWIFYWIGVAGVFDAASTLLIQDPPPAADPWVILALVWAHVGWFALAAVVSTLLLIFPTGRFLSARWTWLGWLAAFWVAVSFIGSALTEDLGPPTSDWTIENPIGLFSAESAENSILAPLFGIGMMIVLVGGAAGIVVRYRRSSPLVRTQIKWVLYSLLAFPAWIMFALVTGTGEDSTLDDLLFFVALGLIPVSITVAITRYRLYEIDRLVNRTVVYAIVVVVLAAVYAGAVVLLRGLLPDGSDLAVAASTLAVAALFNPVRKRVQLFVDRRFYRSRYDANRTIEDFSAQIGNEVDLDQITTDWLGTVNRALKPATASIWIRTRT